MIQLVVCKMILVVQKYTILTNCVFILTCIKHYNKPMKPMVSSILLR